MYVSYSGISPGQLNYSNYPPCVALFAHVLSLYVYETLLDVLTVNAALWE